MRRYMTVAELLKDVSVEVSVRQRVVRSVREPIEVWVSAATL